MLRLGGAPFDDRHYVCGVSGARPGSDGHICTYITMRIQVTYHIPLRLQPIFCRTVVPVPTTCSRTRYENQEATELLLRIPL